MTSSREIGAPLSASEVDVSTLERDNVVDVDVSSEETRQNWFALATEWARRPPFYVINHGTPQAVVGRYKDVKEVVLSPERFTTTPPAEAGALLDPFMGLPTFVRRNGPEHVRLRRIIQPWFGGAGVAKVEASIEQHVAEAMDDLEKHPNPVDLVANFSNQLSPRIMLREMFGFDEEQRALFVNMKKHLDSTVRLGTYTPEYVEAFNKVRALIDETIAERERQPRPLDFIGALVAYRQSSGESFTDDEIAGPVFGICVGGIQTTATETTHVVHRWMKNRADFEVIREDPELLPQAIEETMRIHPNSLFLTPRFVVEDTTLGGVPLLRGMPLHVCSAAANLDPEVFPDPLEFKIGRNPKQTMTFGAGPHFCVGAILARRTIAAGLRAFMNRHPNAELADPDWKPHYVGQLGETTADSMLINLN